MTTMNKEEQKVWFDANEPKIIEFEQKLIDIIKRDMGIEVGYAKLKNTRCRINFDGDHFTGELYHASIQVNSKVMMHRESILARIVMIAHEVGHYLDLLENFNANMYIYMKHSRVASEETAWALAFEFLDWLDIGKEIGEVTWVAFRNVTSLGMASYYRSREELSKEEAKKKADIFASKLVAHKLEKEVAIV